MRPRSHMRLGALVSAAALLGLGGLVLSAGPAAATASASTLTISPGDVEAGSTANNLTLTYTAAATDAGRTLAVTFPSGFSPPQSTNSLGAGFVSAAPGTCGAANLTSISAQVVNINLTCAPGQTATVGWAGVTAPTVAGPYPFTAVERRAAGAPSQTLANPQPLIVDPGPAKKLKASTTPIIDGDCPSTIVVWAIDQYKNLVTGYPGTVTLHSSDAGAMLPAPYTFTANDAGVHAFPVILTPSTTITYTASDTSGTKSFSGSTSVASPTSVSLSPGNATIQVGSSAQYTTTAKFTDGSSCDITNVASYSSSKPAVAGVSSHGLATAVGVGTSQVTAQDGQTMGGTSLTVVPATTTTSLTSTENPSNFGDTVGLTATAASSTSSAPTGTVTFADGATTLATVTLSGGTASYSTSTLAGGSHALSATYNGDAKHSASSGDLSQVVNPVATTTFGSVNGDSVAGDPVTLLASVAPVAGAPPVGPTGTVTFLVDGNPVGSGSLNGAGTAAFADSGADFAGGATTYNITATYNGDPDFTTSTGTTTYTTG